MTNPAQEILIIGLGLIGSSLAKAAKNKGLVIHGYDFCLLYTSPSPRDRTRSRMPSSA